MEEDDKNVRYVYNWYKGYNIIDLYDCTFSKDLIKSIFKFSHESNEYFDHNSIPVIIKEFELNGLIYLFYYWVLYYIYTSLTIMMQEYTFDEDRVGDPVREISNFVSAYNRNIPNIFSIRFSNVSVASYILDNIKNIEKEDIIIKITDESMINIIVDFGYEITMNFTIDKSSYGLIPMNYVVELQEIFNEESFTSCVVSINQYIKSKIESKIRIPSKYTNR